jgi:hypothetical protein
VLHASVRLVGFARAMGILGRTVRRQLRWIRSA